MKKVLFYAFVLMACLVAGCKKDSQKNKVYLLRQQITDYRADGYPVDTANYTYDEKNRITTITDASGTDQIKYVMAYDAQDKVTTARKYNSTGGLIIAFDFFYSGDVTGYYFYGSSHVADTAYFTFNNSRQLTRITTKHSGSQTFAYDSNGNVASTTALPVDGSSNLGDQTSFSYDNRKNPFSQSSANNYFYMYVVRIGNPSTLKNNVLIRNADKFTYTYNPDGFPVSASIKTIRSTLYVYFNYTTK